MKKIVALLLLLTLAVSLVACGGEDGAPDGMKNVAEETAKFFLFVPEGWIEQREGAMSPAGDGANVTAVAYLMESYYTPESYWAEKCLPSYRATFSEITVDEALNGVDTVLGGVNAKKYVYNATLGEGSYRILQVIAVWDNMVYTLTYTATPECFDTHMADVDSICTNFTLK